MEQDLWADFLSSSSMKAAWQKVRRNGGAGGGDGISIAEFETVAPKALRDVVLELSQGRFEFGPCRQVRIAKDGGGVRVLTIPTIRDRVVLTALTDTLTPVLEPQFEASSFAYRAGRSVKQAIMRVEMWRRQGYEHVVEADIEDYFNSVDHDLLKSKLDDALCGKAGAAPIAELIEEALEHNGRELGHAGRGLVQGSPLSPLLANLYLDALNEALDRDGIKIVRYADDFVILCKSGKRAAKALDRISDVLARHHLTLHPAKTGIVHFDDGFEFLGHLFIRSLAIERRAGAIPPKLRKTDDEVAAAEDEPDAKSSSSTRGGGRHDTGFRVAHLPVRELSVDIRNESFSVLMKARELAAIHNDRVDRLEINSNADISWQAVHMCVASGTELAVVDGWGETFAVLSRPNNRSAGRQLAQAKALLDDRLRMEFARRLVDARIRNQRTQLSRLNRRQKNADVETRLKAMARNLRKLPYANTIEQVRGIEGASAALYWPAIGVLCEGYSVPFRRSRPARDPLNASINYFTAILERDVRSAVLRAGLHTGFGMLHSGRDRADGAVYDLMEPFRAPMTEGLAVYLFNARRLRPEMFSRTDQGVRIDGLGRRALIKAYEQYAAKRVNVTGTVAKLAWRPLMSRQARDLAKAFETGAPDAFRPYLMEA